MASNKFLPFIVEKSTPINIYQTLLSRSKGMNTALVSSVFQLVLQEGILKLRETVKQMADLSLSSIYEELINTYPDCKIDDGELSLFLNFETFFLPTDNQSWVDELSDFSLADILVFFLVMAKVDKLEELTDIPFDKVLRHKDRVLADIHQYVKFSDNGEPRYFVDIAELKAFILYTALLSSNSDKDLVTFAIFNGVKDDAMPF